MNPAAPADGSAPPLPLQVNALQALCRQVFGCRLAMIVLAVPFALASAAPGPASWLVGAAVLITFMTSYALLRDWERFGPVLLRHPWILGADMAIGALLLVAASPDSTLAYVTLCTPLLGGLISGWRGGAVLAVLQSALVAGAYAVNDRADAGYTALLLPGLCVLAGGLGSTLRTLMLRFGAASLALSDARARLAAAGAVEDERARLAREMHDSVAKTLHGLALAAEGLARSAGRTDPAAVRDQAELVARAARRAAAESRALLADLRRDSARYEETGPRGDTGGERSGARPVDVLAELAARTDAFARRTGVVAVLRRTGEDAAVEPAVARQLLTIVAEALENAHRHGRPGRVEVRAGAVAGTLRIRVADDGRGLPPGTTLDGLRRAGHFGLVGMAERARAAGARITIGPGPGGRGTEVRLDLPLPAPHAPCPDPLPGPTEPTGSGGSLPPEPLPLLP
ncbi:sensor histidine kinase [Streptomyces yaizuensis]|uniref:Two-component sensor histidine kinase n=1 Tax=Streptomyces yaizuensis TaxID=2989713 RepID=A0ABQ5NVJ8_9ACTN|nr:histidine kinase [Streptomyces sp. YSPA8]GLF94380.1 two-component sensor histidine kinase [Streptomyces sp. YSPA8]